MPEALTEWKLMAFMHDKKVRSGFIDGKTVTSLDLMVRPNPPRFLREGDVLEFTTRVLNTGETARTGVVKLDLKNAITDESADALLETLHRSRLTIPAEHHAFFWLGTGRQRTPSIAFASAGDQADAEENHLPYFRRILVTESLLLLIRDKGMKKFLSRNWSPLTSWIRSSTNRSPYRSHPTQPGTPCSLPALSDGVSASVH